MAILWPLLIQNGHIWPWALGSLDSIPSGSVVPLAMFYSEVWMPLRSFFSLKEEANLFLANGLQPFSGLTCTWGDAAEGGGFSSWSNCCCHCTALCEKYFLQLRIHCGHSVKLPDSALKIFWQIDDSPSLENYQFHPMKLTNGRHCKGYQLIYDWDLSLYIK